MRSKFRLSILVVIALGLSLAWSDPAVEPPKAAPAVDSSKVHFISESATSGNPYFDHAPLAWFSVGSLAVGGVIYSIQTQTSAPHTGYVSSGQSQMTTAIAAAGVTALVAGVSYFYFAHRDEKKAADWDPQVSGGVAPDGTVTVGAIVTIPISLRFL